MLLLRIAGLAVFVIVLLSAAADVYGVLVLGDKHPLVTGPHVGMLAVGLLALAISSKMVRDTILEFIHAWRGGKAAAP